MERETFSAARGTSSLSKSDPLVPSLDPLWGSAWRRAWPTCSDLDPKTASCLDCNPVGASVWLHD